MPAAKIATLTFRIDPGVKETLLAVTAQEHRSNANMVVVLIMDYYEPSGNLIAEPAARARTNKK
ncbi:MAG: hypothetical protein N0E48_28620 [Candidatus Thiodiazotropha endolucinida]|nr:hypothetical protein [Candidatus Thiodiazotropha taylori]MCW4347281.1 hypothetical protein [Candidatus Thiodiazotropha endolucinida]